MKRDIQTQANAAHGFSVWLTSTLPRQTDESKEFSDHVLHVLRIYEWELSRQLDGGPGTQDWYQLVATTSILARMLQDELLELNPTLVAYSPSDEPQTIQEMISRLLSDALVLFEVSQKEMATYLEKPVVPGVLTDFIQRVLTPRSD